MHWKDIAGCLQAAGERPLRRRGFCYGSKREEGICARLLPSVVETIDRTASFLFCFVVIPSCVRDLLLRHWLCRVTLEIGDFRPISLHRICRNRSCNCLWCQGLNNCWCNFLKNVNALLKISCSAKIKKIQNIYIPVYIFTIYVPMCYRMYVLHLRSIINKVATEKEWRSCSNLNLYRFYFLQ